MIVVVDSACELNCGQAGGDAGIGAFADLPLGGGCEDAGRREADILLAIAAVIGNPRLHAIGGKGKRYGVIIEHVAPPSVVFGSWVNKKPRPTRRRFNRPLCRPGLIY